MYEEKDENPADADYLNIPSFWVHHSGVPNSGYFLICTAINGKNDKYCSEEIQFNYEQKYNFEISQSDGIFQIRRDGVVLSEVENTEPQNFDYVKAFLSNPWYDGFNGCLENLKVSRDNEILYGYRYNGIILISICDAAFEWYDRSL